MVLTLNYREFQSYKALALIHDGATSSPVGRYSITVV